MTTTLEQYLAKHRKSRKHFSRLHGDYLQEIQAMATPVSSNNMSTHTSAVKVQIGRQPNVASEGRQAEAANPATVSPERGITPVNSQVGKPVARPVDRKTIEGSTPGDHRAQPGDTVKATLDRIANPPAPREQMRGQKNTRFYDPDGTAFTSNEFGSAESK